MTASWPDDARPRRRAGVLARREGEDLVLYRPGSESFSQLNASAGALWELCDGDTTTAEIVAALTELTGRPAAEMRALVTDTLDRLVQSDLLDRSGTAEPD